MAAATGNKPKTSPKAVKFLFGGLAGMGATVFVQPLDLVKNRMQLSGEGSKAREYKTSFHALSSILRNEGLRGIYTGWVWSELQGALSREGGCRAAMEASLYPDGVADPVNGNKESIEVLGFANHKLRIFKGRSRRNLGWERLMLLRMPKAVQKRIRVCVPKGNTARFE
ncbi:UNVERIFIED_CONTAM: hypothetical protein FKN15_016407 [Acipenser sinensis]